MATSINNKSFLLSPDYEPTDEELKKIMNDALKEVLINKQKANEVLKQQALYCQQQYDEKNRSLK
jgi:hypothetical protein